jgi:two-component system LytT family sensor kinase
MLESLDLHEPLLVNAIGHSVGLLLFAGFLALVLRDKRRGHGGPSNLLPIAAGLALLWNAGSLIVLAASSGLLATSDLVAAISFAVLSLLPAALLHLSLKGRVRPIWIAGWALGIVAAGLHLAELGRPDVRFHQAALWVIILGFGLLTLMAMLTNRRLAPSARLGAPRITASMCLFLFAISFVHFNPGHVRYAWSGEIAFHHAGIPLALYVLSQDYRFLLLDAFLRFLTNSIVAGGAIILSLALNSRFHILDRVGDNPFLQGILVVLVCMVLIALSFVRGRLQLLLTRVLFRRSDHEPAIRAIRAAGSTAESEAGLLHSAEPIIAAFVQADRCEIRELKAREEQMFALGPILASDSSQPWAEVCVPIRFLKGDGVWILVGRREGGLRYLSEDLQELSRLAGVVAEQVERLRNSEIQRLVSQAELRALQSQINPHFLFNALNTLYGTIPRDAPDARRMVLNLAEIFRYFLQSDRTFISLAEELQIVRAYLQIEMLRLGDKLKSEIDVDESAERALIPVLSIQPLVENAVKHGVAARSTPGSVRIRARMGPGGILVEVSDSGAGFRGSPRTTAGAGIGLENVRQRLKLCYGEATSLSIDSTDRGSIVSFLVPLSHAVPLVAEKVST